MNDSREITTLRTQLREAQEALAKVQKENEQLEATTKHLNFLDNALDGFFFTNERDELLFVNYPLLRMLGYAEIDRPVLIGSPLPMLHWQNSDDLERIRQQLKQEGLVRDLRVGMNALDGRTLTVALSAVVTRDGAGVDVGTQYTLHELPQRTGRGTAELRAENRELAALTAIGRSVLSTMSVDEVVQHLMQTVLNFFDVRIAWVYLKQRDGSRVLAAHTGLNDEQLRNVQAAVDDLFDLRLLSEDGRPRLISSQKSKTGLLVANSLGVANLAIAPLLAHDPPHGAAREPMGMLIVSGRSRRFLTEEDMASLERIAQYAGLALSNAMLYGDLQQAYEELKRAQAQLVEAERQKAAVAMAGAAAHELNQPLTVLLGYSNLLGRMMKEDDPQRSIYEKIERATRKISEVVERLGQITRFSTRPYVEGQPIVDIYEASRPAWSVAGTGEGESPDES